VRRTRSRDCIPVVYNTRSPFTAWSVRLKSLLLIPGPVVVAEPVLAAMARPMINHRGPEFAELLGRVTGRMRSVFGTSGDVVLLGGSGTAGLEASIASLFSPGDRVLTCPVGIFGRRFSAIARTYGLEVDEIATPLGSAMDPAALAARVAGDREHAYAGILLTQNETSTGVENDMPALAQAVGDHPAIIVVDAISGLAASDFRMDEWRFDVVVGASQKALAAPPGLSMVAVSGRAWDRAARSGAPSFYLDLRRARDAAKDGQTPWTPPVSIVYALDAALDIYESTGEPNVWARHARYAAAIRAAAAALGVETLSQPGAHSPTVVALRVPDGIEGPAVARMLREEHGVVIGGGQQELKGKIWRIGTMGNITQVDVLGAIGALEMVLRRLGHSAQRGAGVSAALQVFES
jgi:aspartate aminotransferase-like enzyme